ACGSDGGSVLVEPSGVWWCFRGADRAYLSGRSRGRSRPGGVPESNRFDPKSASLIFQLSGGSAAKRRPSDAHRGVCHPEHRARGPSDECTSVVEPDRSADFTDPERAGAEASPDGAERCVHVRRLSRDRPVHRRTPLADRSAPEPGLGRQPAGPGAYAAGRSITGPRSDLGWELRLLRRLSGPDSVRAPAGISRNPHLLGVQELRLVTRTTEPLVTRR